MSALSGTKLLFLLAIVCSCQAKRLKIVQQQLETILQSLGTLRNTCCISKIAPERLPSGYFLAFRIQPGTDVSAYDTYVDKNIIDDDDRFVNHHIPRGCRTTDGKLPCHLHFRSQILNDWRSLPIERVRVGVYKDNKEQRFFEFNGEGSTFTNWFSKERLIDSSYTDLKRASTNYFSIQGDKRHDRDRRFFINERYGGCPNDAGWLVVLGAQRPCQWEKKSHKYPIILYSKTDACSNYNNADNIGIADTLIISVKLSEVSSV